MADKQFRLEEFLVLKDFVVGLCDDLDRLKENFFHGSFSEDTDLLG